MKLLRNCLMFILCVPAFGISNVGAVIEIEAYPENFPPIKNVKMGNDAIRAGYIQEFEDGSDKEVNVPILNITNNEFKDMTFRPVAEDQETKLDISSKLTKDIIETYKSADGKEILFPATWKISLADPDQKELLKPFFGSAAEVPAMLLYKAHQHRDGQAIVVYDLTSYLADHEPQNEGEVALVFERVLPAFGNKEGNGKDIKSPLSKIEAELKVTYRQNEYAFSGKNFGRLDRAIRNGLTLKKPNAGDDASPSSSSSSSSSSSEIIADEGADVAVRMEWDQKEGTVFASVFVNNVRTSRIRMDRVDAVSSSSSSTRSSAKPTGRRGLGTKRS